MKTLGTLLVLFSALMLVACQEKPVSPDTPYIIEGYVPSIKDGVEIKMYQYYGDLIAKDTIENGKFYFKEQIREDNTNLGNNTHLRLTIHRKKSGGGTSVSVHVKPGAKVKVTGLDNYVELWNVDSPTSRQHLYNELRHVAKQEIKEWIDLHYALTDDDGALHSWEDAYRINDAYLKADKKMLDYMEGMEVTEAWMEELRYHIDTDSFLDNFPHQEQLLSLYDKLSDAQKQSLLGQEMYAKLNPPQQVQIGDFFPDTELYDLQGNLHHISEFKGKYILLDFWSRGCGPCLASFPKMKELYEEAGDRLTIISISIDPEKHWRTASEKHELTWNNWNELKGRAGLYTNYRINAIPFYVLINPEGKIVETIRGFNKNYLMEAIGLK